MHRQSCILAFRVYLTSPQKIHPVQAVWQIIQLRLLQLNAPELGQRQQKTQVGAYCGKEQKQQTSTSVVTKAGERFQCTVEMFLCVSPFERIHKN